MPQLEFKYLSQELKKKKVKLPQSINISLLRLHCVSPASTPQRTAQGCWRDTVSDLGAQTKGEANTGNPANPRNSCSVLLLILHEII